MNRNIKRILDIQKQAIEILKNDQTSMLLYDLYQTIQQHLSETDRDLYTRDSLVEQLFQDSIGDYSGSRSFYPTDEEENAVDYIENASHALRQDTIHKWKWVIISIHGALYGLMISALGRSNPALVLNKNMKDNSAEPFLISFKQALDKIQQKQHVYFGDPLILDDREKDSIGSLSYDYRNRFMHFSPQGLSIHLPFIIVECFNVLRPLWFVAFKSGGIMQYKKQIRAYWSLRDLIQLMVLEYTKIRTWETLDAVTALNNARERSSKIMKYW